MNKFMKKIMSKKDGFTLVELIVVIAILAILAGVAVPVYSGYIKKANAAADDQVIEAVNTAISAAVAMEGLDVEDADAHIEVSFSEGVITVTKKTGTGVNGDVFDNFVQFHGSAATTTKLAYYVGATLGENGVVTGTKPSGN